jgi:histidyl-tRNA synthetase
MLASSPSRYAETEHTGVWIFVLTIIQFNHRKILDGIFEVCGVPADKIRSISSAVDKLDKV